jgi:hypothetical protein
MKRALLAALLAAGLVGCGVRVAVETDPAARHGAWKEWSWLARPPVARGDTEYAAIDERVRQAFQREMKTRGFRQVERAEHLADLAAVGAGLELVQLERALGALAEQADGEAAAEASDRCGERRGDVEWAEHGIYLTETDEGRKMKDEGVLSAARSGRVLADSAVVAG